MNLSEIKTVLSDLVALASIPQVAIYFTSLRPSFSIILLFVDNMFVSFPAVVFLSGRAGRQRRKSLERSSGEVHARNAI